MDNTITKDEQVWLRANRDLLERTIINRLLFDAGFRVGAVGVIESRDFSDELLGAIAAGIAHAVTMMSALPNVSVPVPPSYEYILPYMKAVNMEEDIYDDDDLPKIHRLFLELSQEADNEQWYIVDAYFKAWFLDSRTKRYSMEAQMQNVANAQSFIDKLQSDIQQAESAVDNEEDDEFHKALYGEVSVEVERRSTGIPAIDSCIGGGLGKGETGLIIAGSGAGKTIACCQMVAYDMHTKDGFPLIISTEVPPNEYLSRMVSNICNIDNDLVKDCGNMLAVKGKVLSTAPHKQNKFNKFLDRIKERLQIIMIDAEAGMSGKQALESAIAKFEKRMGRMPTSVHFDWLGDIADNGNARSSGDRIMLWERAAASFVSGAKSLDIPLVVYAQGTTDIHLTPIPGREHIGISKGIDKKMIWALAISSLIDKQAKADAMKSGSHKADTTLDDQRFCVWKSRKGIPQTVPCRREFKYQRFLSV